MSTRRARAVARPTTLLVVGATRWSGGPGDWHTLVALSKQLDVWFDEFDQVLIAAHVLDGEPPPFHRRLEHQNIEFAPLQQAGGSGVRAKLGVLAAALSWVRVLVPLMRRATAVHLRTPCNVTIVAIPLARLLCRRRYAIYADNWELQGIEPASFRFQRWMLRHFGHVVHAYVPPGVDLPGHIRENVSPSFTTAELDILEGAAQERLDRLVDEPMTSRELRVCTVATFSDRKNQAGVIRAVARLRGRGIDVEARFAGTGRSEEQDRALASELGVDDCVHFMGHLGRTEVDELFRWADVNVLVSKAEGFGKVFLEGMAVGCPAVCGPGGMQQTIIGDGSRGRQADPQDPADIADALAELRSLPPEAHAAMIRNCRDYVRHYTTEAFAAEIHTIVADIWELPPALRTRRP